MVDRDKVLHLTLHSFPYTEHKIKLYYHPHLLPGAGAIGLASSIHSCLVLPKVHQSGGQAAKVGNIVVKQFGCLVHLVVIATVTYLKEKCTKGKQV